MPKEKQANYCGAPLRVGALALDTRYSSCYGLAIYVEDDTQKRFAVSIAKLNRIPARDLEVLEVAIRAGKSWTPR